MSLGVDLNASISLPMNQLLRGNVSLRAITFAGSATTKKVVQLDNQTCALVLAIQMNHVTGTNSVLQIYHRDGNPVPAFQATIPSATATGSYDGFSASTAEGHAGWLPIFVPPLGSVYIASDATATFTVYILEWKK
jgi:hypothetical protein